MPFHGEPDLEPDCGVTTINNTGGVIDLLAVKKNYFACPADATHGFFQVPQDELWRVQPLEEWIRRWVARGGSATAIWRMKR
eukprot:6383023-Amphidinium_carterae.1